jgi:hypothetical protein
MLLDRGVVFSHEAMREWEAKLAPVLSEILLSSGAVVRGGVGIATKPILK